MRSDTWHKIHRLHGEGLSATSVARLLSMQEYKVRRILLESGALERQYEYGVRDYRLLEASREGLTQKEICDNFHIPVSLLIKVLKTHGEPPRPRKQRLDKELVQGVVADYLDSDLTRDEICSEYSISASVLSRILDEEDVPRRTPTSRSNSTSLGF
jgi:uncharacterized protein (DUF433 family)